MIDLAITVVVFVDFREPSERKVFFMTDKGDYSSLRQYSAKCRRFMTLCNRIQVGRQSFDNLFDVYKEIAPMSSCKSCLEDLSLVASADSESKNIFFAHLDLVEKNDKPKFHGSGRSISEAKGVACEAAMTWLEKNEPEIMDLRNKRLRIRLEDLGITVPKTYHMRLLEDGREEGLEGLPSELVEILTLEDPEDRKDIGALSKKFLETLSLKKSHEIEEIFAKLGLSFCDELNRGMNVFLFAALVTLFLRLDVNNGGLDSNEKLKLSFCKLVEQVLVFNAWKFPGFKIVTGRLLRYFLEKRAVPFMARNRMELLALQLSRGGPQSMKIDDPEHLSKLNESALLEIVGKKTPKKEYLESLFFEFEKINKVIRALFDVDGNIYGSLVNGFPTSSSDIDVVINLPQQLEQGVVSDEPALEDAGEDAQEPPSSKNLVELNQLYEAMVEEFKDEFVLQKIETARVPILVARKNNIEINISFNHQVVIHNSALLKAYSEISPRVRELVILVKHWAKQRELNDALQGTLSSYSYVLLVISFLQQKGLLPDLQSSGQCPLPERITDNGRCSTWFAAPDSIADILSYSQRLNSHSLTFLLVSFFDFYLYDFDYINDLVSVSRRIPRRREVDGDSRLIMELSKSKFVKKIDFFESFEEVGQVNFTALRKRCWLSIIDPFEFNRCLGVSARGMETLVKDMKRSQELLLDGHGAAVFAPFKKHERVQLPPFPHRELNKFDPVKGFENASNLRKVFLHDDVSLALLSEVVELAKQEAGNRASTLDSNHICCLSYLSKLGLPKQADFEKIAQNGKPVVAKVNELTRKAPQVATTDNRILDSKKAFLKVHPDPKIRSQTNMPPRSQKMQGKQIGTSN